MIEIEIQNETHQTQTRIRFAAVPRIGEGIRLREPDGIWASYDVLDVWYQKAEFGDVWMPYLHIRMTPGEGYGDDSAGGKEETSYKPDQVYAPKYRDEYVDEDTHDYQREGQFASLAGEAEPFKI